ncbi:hypothetical protein [Flammeovirga kamogawensis]|uniref:DUF3139 domain-containing protein n=1 Tax=Flammeovirga kamogawensis TaxID=373891 RepID=A0ABX8H538_9BACT|nr:hypothetical protein [Flammeovirga kamogawensis]MBB6461781.1 hypothetical protein [Flammeovirga kamogawensis]QWG10697.1 hypothetical protein KM029_25270 [Flammeovirga kamogawensis]TRX63799.1 hypothetical protein EO216_25640 [Flammeovirga kamogawensis]
MKNLKIIIFFLINLCFFSYMFLLITEKNKIIKNYKDIKDKTGEFYSLILKDQIFNINQLEGLDSSYEVDKKSAYHYIIYPPPKMLNHDFFGYEILVDSSANTLIYIGYFKP